MSTEDTSFPPPARGVVGVEELKQQSHLDGWNLAVERALKDFKRQRGQTYQVNVVLSAAVEETDNPGRITAYIATLI
jgi:hypothetical protein